MMCLLLWITGSEKLEISQYFESVEMFMYWQNTLNIIM